MNYEKVRKLKINQRKAGTILSYVSLLLTNTITLFYTPLFLSGLGQREYGLFGTANSLTSYLGLLSFGIAGAYIKFNMEYRAKGDKEGEKRLNGMFLTVYSVLSVLVLIVGGVLTLSAPVIFGAKYTTTELYDIQIMMMVTVVNTMVTFIFNVIAMALQAYEEFVFIRICMLISGLATPVVNLVLVYGFNGKAVTISFGTLAISLAQYIAFFIYAKKRLKIGFVFKGMEKKVLKAVFVFSSYLILGSITELLLNSTDNVILGVASGPVAVAVYTVGSNFKNYFLTFSTSVSNVFAAQVNKVVASCKTGNIDKSTMDNELNSIFQKIGRVQNLIVSLILIGFIFVGQQFINLWVGPEYGDAYYIALFLFIGFYVPCFQNVGLEIQKAKNKHKTRSVIYLLVAILNVLITIPLSMKWAGIGAAFATCICMLGGNFIFMNIYYHKKIGLDMIAFWKQILRLLPGYIVTAIAGVLVKHYLPMTNYWQLLMGVVIILVVYIFAVWFLSMNQYEKDLIKKPLASILRKFKKQ